MAPSSGLTGTRSQRCHQSTLGAAPSSSIGDQSAGGRKTVAIGVVRGARDSTRRFGGHQRSGDDLRRLLDAARVLIS